MKIHYMAEMMSYLKLHHVVHVVCCGRLRKALEVDFSICLSEHEEFQEENFIFRTQAELLAFRTACTRKGE
jgi:hypothetical protein